MQGQLEEGYIQMRQGIDAVLASGSVYSRPYYLALLADIQLKMGKPDEGLQSIEEALRVVADTGEGRQEQLALGETPNVAARIQGIAEPDTVVISADTHRLIQGYFDCETLGERTLRGVADQIAVYRVLGESGVQSRLDVASGRGLTPLVGRESEVTLLLERWEQAKDGQGQVVIVSGEAGIGKSRLLQVLKDHAVDDPHTRLECRSSPYFTNSALYPITDLLQRTLRWQPDDTPEQRLEKLEYNLSQYRLPLEETVPLLSTLLSLPVPEEPDLPLTLSPQRQRQKTLESILAIILELSERQPVVFILEDLHWTDPSTLELLDLLIDQSPTASMVLLLTCRPTFQPRWGLRTHLTPIALNRLARPQVECMIGRVVGERHLPLEVVDYIVRQSDGVPLYVEEMTKTVLESDILREADDRYELTGAFSSLSIPATLQDSLMARLDRLVSAKGIAQMGATIGRQFSYHLLQAVSQLDAPTLQRELHRLVEAELLYQRGLPPQSVYTFKHALIQDVAYQSLLKRTRQYYHQRVTQVLCAEFPEVVENQPELLAHHYTEAELSEPAIDAWRRAGEHANVRSGCVEAETHLRKGLEMLQRQPESRERKRQELALQLALAESMAGKSGYTTSDLEAIYTQARTLAQQVGHTSDLLSVLQLMRRYYTLRGEPHSSRELCEELLALAQRTQEPGLLQAHKRIEKTRLRRFESYLNWSEGELLLTQATQADVAAEDCFLQALDIARGQQVKAWELRAATSLARLWQSQGKNQDVYGLLDSVYGWFTEGFDTADLREAKALLSELEAER